MKIALHNKRSGAFKANAVLTRNQSGCFQLVFKPSQIDLGDRAAQAGGEFVSRDELAALTLYPAPKPEYSFITVMLDPSFEGTPLGDYEMRYYMGNEAAVTQTADGDTVDFDALFSEQQTATAAIAGVAVKPGYQQGRMYSGFGSYHGHSQRGMFNAPLHNDKPWRIGVELEVYANSQQAFNTITTARSNWFQCERDGSLTEAPNAIELKTIPLKASDAKSVDFWSDPMAKLKTLAKTKGYSTTGLHVHISKEILGDNEGDRQENLRKLTWFYTYFVEDDPVAHQKNVIICGREHGYHAGSCKTPKGDFAKECGLKKFADSPFADDVMRDVTERTRTQRSDINIGNWNSYGTIEFRKGKGIISRTRLAAICTWWEQMCLYCVRTAPRDLDFNDFFNAVVRDYPAVAYFFQTDEEC